MHAAVCTKIYSNKTNNYFRVDKCKTSWEWASIHKFCRSKFNIIITIVLNTAIKAQFIICLAVQFKNIAIIGSEVLQFSEHDII